jgi:hypothetical protein
MATSGSEMGKSTRTPRAIEGYSLKFNCGKLLQCDPGDGFEARCQSLLSPRRQRSGAPGDRLFCQ